MSEPLDTVERLDDVAVLSREHQREEREVRVVDDERVGHKVQQRNPRAPDLQVQAVALGADGNLSGIGPVCPDVVLGAVDPLPVQTVRQPGKLVAPVHGHGEVEHELRHLGGRPTAVHHDDGTEAGVEIRRDVRHERQVPAPVGDDLAAAQGLDVEAVAVVEARSELGGLGGEQREALLREDAPVRARPAVEQHADVGRHVGRRRGDAAVAGRVFVPAGGHEGTARQDRAIVLQGLVGDGRESPRFVRDGTVRGDHAERLQDARLENITQRLVANRLQQQAEGLVPDVGVVKPVRPRGATRVAQRPGLVVSVRSEVRAGDDACRVGQQFVDGDRITAGSDLEPWQVVLHRGVQIDRAALVLLQ